MIIFDLQEWRQVLRNDPCAYCGGPSEAIDHIEARSRGGSNAWDNLTPACARCNSSKRTRPLLTYLAERHEGQGGQLLSFRLPIGEYERVRRQAKHNHRTVTGEIRRGIDLILETDEEMQEAA